MPTTFRPCEPDQMLLALDVREWVEDCANAGYHGAPTDGSEWEVGDCSERVARGGSWKFEPGFLRSAARAWGAADHRHDDGFRVARTLTP